MALEGSMGMARRRRRRPHGLKAVLALVGNVPATITCGTVRQPPPRRRRWLAGPALAPPRRQLAATRRPRSALPTPPRRRGGGADWMKLRARVRGRLMMAREQRRA
eukprot:gene14441-2924_t